MVHYCGNRLFHQMGRTSVICNSESQGCGEVHLQEHHYIYGVPNEFISDHGSHFQGEVLPLLEKYKTTHHQSSPYQPQTNGAVEAANKNVKSILQKMTDTYKDWHEKLPFALWGYRTSVRTCTGATPYLLVYGMEAVLPIEVEIPSFRVLAECEISEFE